MKNVTKTQKIARVGFVLTALLIFYFSAQPSEESNALSDFVARLLHIQLLDPNKRLSAQPLIFGLSLRKFAHMTVFGTLGIFAWLSLPETEPKWHRTLYAIAICYLYACFDEIHQTFVPERTGQFSDTLIDLIGILIGIGILLLIRHLHRRRLQNSL